MTDPSGRHFLQIPGPTNVPDRILRAIDNPTIDHRGPEFQRLGLEILDGIKKVFRTAQPVLIFPGSGTGAWEAALVNTHNPGDKVLMYETGWFSTLWFDMACRLGLRPEFIKGEWGRGVDAALIGERLEADKEHRIRAVCIVHNETSTGVTSSVLKARKAIDDAGHPALLMVDTISSLASIDYRHAEWGVDVTVGGSQKGLMLPPGLGFNAVSEKAIDAAQSARMPRSYWDWSAMIDVNKAGMFPYTPSTNLLFGLAEAIKMLLEEGLENVFARHFHLADATRRCVQHWGIEMLCQDPAEYSHSLTAVVMPEGFDADVLRKLILDRFNMSLGNGLGRLKGRVFRIGHLGDFNALMLAGTLAGIEMGLAHAGIPHEKGGVTAALEYLVGNAPPPQ